MSKQATKTFTISLPDTLTNTVDVLSKKIDQTRSEFVGMAVREFLLDIQDDRNHFLEAYKKTRNEKVLSLSELRKKYDLV
ncbi:MAG: hypothetical protein WC654_04080 [Patescibacteria group bacterium]